VSERGKSFPETFTASAGHTDFVVSHDPVAQMKRFLILLTSTSSEAFSRKGCRLCICLAHLILVPQRTHQVENPGENRSMMCVGTAFYPFL